DGLEVEGGEQHVVGVGPVDGEGVLVGQADVGEQAGQRGDAVLVDRRRDGDVAQGRRHVLHGDGHRLQVLAQVVVADRHADVADVGGGTVAGGGAVVAVLMRQAEADRAGGGVNRLDRQRGAVAG